MLRADLVSRFDGQGVAPAALCALESELPYRVTLGWALPSGG